jgi:capreomycidine synthase
MQPATLPRMDPHPGLRGIEPALLERWMREFYFEAEIDIGSSSVQSYSLTELRRLCAVTDADLDAIVFDDSRTQGGDRLRNAIAVYTGLEDPAQVLVTHGSSEAIFFAMHALLAAGDEVIALDPIYPQLYAIADHLGCRMKRWQMPLERAFVPDFSSLERLISGSTRMVVVNFPHNPCGVSLNPAQQAELIRIVSRSGAYLLWDGAFSQLELQSNPLPIPNLSYERAVTLGTLSKAYGLPGVRVGWLLASPGVIETCLHLRDYLTLHLSPLIELLAQRAIENAPALLRPRLEQARTNLRHARAWALGHEDLVQWIEPMGGVSAFPLLRGVADEEALCRRLAQQFKVLLVPGRCFGHPGHVRLGFGGASARFTEGIRRLELCMTGVPS